MTLTFELDLDTVKVTQQAKYIGQRSFRSKIIVRPHTHIHPSVLHVQLIQIQYK